VGACGSATALADEVPIRMNSPSQDTVTPTSIKFSWNPISLNSDTGRDAVIYYHVDWEETTGKW
jgi:hypothetical protein